MTPEELDNKLHALTAHEELYRQGWINPQIAQDMKTEIINGQAVQRYRLGGAMPLMSGSKHSRFNDYPLHIHPWMELNYMYSGSCEQIVNGKHILTKQGQMLLLNQNTLHKVPVLGENDILLGIYICKEYLTSTFFTRLSQRNILSQFFINSITDGLAHDNYIFFNAEHSRRLPLFIQEFFCEVYDPGTCSEDTLNSLFILILTELLQVYHCTVAKEPHLPQNTTILPILRYIEEHYQSITLKELASTFSLNPTYLSNLLKAKTGSSFKELVTRQRIITARQLLLNSSLSISEVAHQVGYENTTFFYKKFQSMYDCSPSEYRKKGY